MISVNKKLTPAQKTPLKTSSLGVSSNISLTTTAAANKENK
jgi:hypothetical protein